MAAQPLTLSDEQARGRIFDLLMQAPEPLTINQIRASLGMKPDRIRRLLEYMQVQDDVTRIPVKRLGHTHPGFKPNPHRHGRQRREAPSAVEPQRQQSGFVSPVALGWQPSDIDIREVIANLSLGIEAMQIQLETLRRFVEETSHEKATAARLGIFDGNRAVHCGH